MREVYLVSALVEQWGKTGHRAQVGVFASKEEAIGSSLELWQTEGWSVSSYDCKRCDTVVPKDSPQVHVVRLDALYAVGLERGRQVTAGYDAAHDDKHRDGEILWSRWGAVSRLNAALDNKGNTENYKKMLTQAAAQIVAEIERIQRSQPK